MVAERQPLQTYLDELLAEQGRLQTPAAQAGAVHDQAVRGQSVQPGFQTLIPLTAPGPGEQYAFEVDLDSCSGCKACVVACHALNGLDDDESWRDVGLVHGGTERAPFQQTITTACHHCADPACLNGCPVLAYEKDPATGIVRHLDDQCIGCQYCVLKCPYDVPKYSERLGIVRKCDLCHQRLGAGEAPACAQACPTMAITIVKVTVPAGRPEAADTSAFLAAAPDPAYTRPTTRYLSSRPLPAGLQAADATILRPQPPHWPLVFMLTLLPAAIGGFTSAAFLPSPPGLLLRLSWLAGAAGLGASVLHLGQPWRAWRIFLGWRESWLSREAMVLGAWFGLATVTAISTTGRLFIPVPPRTLLWATSLAGLAGLFCSVMVYADTRRHFWRLANTGPRFFGSTAVLGLAMLLAVAPGRAAAFALLGASLLKLAHEVRATRPLNLIDEYEPSSDPSVQSARLLAGRCRPVFGLRAVLGLAGGVFLPFALATQTAPASLAGLAILLVFAGELAERHLFFRVVDAPKMPGLSRP